MATTEPIPPMLAALAPPTAAEIQRRLQVGYLLAVAGAVLWSTKGIFIKRCTLTSTMGPGLHVNVRDAAV